MYGVRQCRPGAGSSSTLPPVQFRSLLCLLLVVTACAPGAASVPPTSTTTSTSTTTTSTTTSTLPPTTTTTLGAVSPLNGLAAGDPTLLERRVMAVKIDNHWNARPQSGLQEADAVYELLVEAGLTRFIALFHDADSSFVGPVRSGRPTDPTVLRPLGATFAISGAQDWVIGLILSQGVPLLGEGAGTYRISGRRAPHNLYADTSALRRTADGRGYDDQPPPADLFTWGEIEQPWRGSRAFRVEFHWSSNYSNAWEWDGSRYLRFHGDTPHGWLDADGETGQVAADSLVVIFAPRYSASGRSGSPVPALDTVGEGRALVFAQAKVFEGTWSRASSEEPFDLTDGEERPMIVPRGIPWISVFPADRDVTW